MGRQICLHFFAFFPAVCGWMRLQEERISASEALLKGGNGSGAKFELRSDGFASSGAGTKAAEQVAQTSLATQVSIESVFEGIEPGVGFLIQESLSRIGVWIRDILDQTDGFAVVGGPQGKIGFIPEEEVLLTPPKAIDLPADEASQMLAQFGERTATSEGAGGRL